MFFFHEQLFRDHSALWPRESFHFGSWSLGLKVWKVPLYFYQAVPFQLFGIHLLEVTAKWTGQEPM